jgi:hypothetical protein
MNMEYPSKFPAVTPIKLVAKALLRTQESQYGWWVWFLSLKKDDRSETTALCGMTPPRGYLS